MNRVANRLREHWGLVRQGPKALTGPRTVRLFLWLALVLSPIATVTLIAIAVMAGGAAAWFAALSVIALTAALALIRPTRSFDVAPTTRDGLSVGPPQRDPAGRLDSAIGRPDLGLLAPHAHDTLAEPAVTVVVTNHNDGRYLGASLWSIQRQSFEQWECIVVDDDSSDESLDVALLFAEKDSRFRIVAHSRNLGLSAARNTGLQMANGEFVTFLDADDYLHASSLERRMAGMPIGGNAVGTYCDWRPAPESCSYFSESDQRALPKPDVHLFTTGWRVPFIASAPIIRRDVMIAAGGFDESRKTAEDADMWARVLRGGVYFRYVTYVGIAYRQRGGSMIRRSPLDHFREVDTVAGRLDTPLEETWPGSPIPLRQPLRDYAKDVALLDRRLNSLALQMALQEQRTDQFEFLPSIELRSLPDYEQRVRDQAQAALQRLGARSPATGEEIADKLLELAPSHQPTIDTPPALARKMRSGVRPLHAPMSKSSVRSLIGGEPVFVMAPQSRYHVDEVGPLLEELSDRGIASEVYVPPEAPEGVVRELSRYVDRYYVGSPDSLLGLPFLGCLVLNDWAPSTRALIAATKAYGGTSFAKVEGVQDFEDVDTGRVRSPYRTADIVLGQGGNDVDALRGVDIRIVGSSRLERMWRADPVITRGERVLINFNFTYGVLTEHQEAWIRMAVAASRRLGLDYEISVHPAQKNVPDSPEIQAHVSTDPFSHSLLRSTILVTRFSTVAFEAMARGVPLVYFNPHGERVRTFSQPDGAFLLETSPDLSAALREAREWRTGFRARASQFFLRQVDVDDKLRSETRAADVIASVVR